MNGNPEVHTQASRGAEIERRPRRSRHILEFMPESEVEAHLDMLNREIELASEEPPAGKAEAFSELLKHIISGSPRGRGGDR